MAPRAITVIAYTLLPFVSPYRYRRNRSWIFSRPFYCYGPCLCRCPDHLLCKQAEIQSKSLFWLRFRISDEAKYVPKMFLLRWAAQIHQRCVPMQPTTEGRNGVQPTPMLLGLCDPSVNSRTTNFIRTCRSWP